MALQLDLYLGRQFQELFIEPKEALFMMLHFVIPGCSKQLVVQQSQMYFVFTV